MTSPTESFDRHRSILHILSVLHYVLAILTVLGSFFFMIYIVLGGVFVTYPDIIIPSHPGEPSPEFIGWLFIALGAVFILLAWTMAALTAYSGYAIAKRRHHLFVVIVAGLLCLLCIPLGTVLGIFTMVTLFKDDVRSRFEGQTS